MDTNVNYFIIFVMVTYFAILSGLIFAIIRFAYISEQKNYHIFKGNLVKAITNKNVCSNEDIDFVYKYSNMKSYSNNKLRNYLVNFVGEITVDSGQIKKEDIPLSLIKAYCKELENKSPFEKLAETEKILLNDIVSFIDLKENHKAKEKLYSLSDVIFLKEEAYKKIKKSNQYSVPVAIFGIFLTVLFGVVSLIN